MGVGVVRGRCGGSGPSGCTCSTLRIVLQLCIKTSASAPAAWIGVCELRSHVLVWPRMIRPPRRELVRHPESDSITLNLGMLRGAQSTSFVFRSAICSPTSNQLSTRTLDSPLLLTERYRHRLSTTPVRGERAPSLFTVGCHILRILGHLKLASSRPFHLRNG